MYTCVGGCGHVWGVTMFTSIRGPVWRGVHVYGCGCGSGLVYLDPYTDPWGCGNLCVDPYTDVNTWVCGLVLGCVRTREGVDPRVCVNL